MIPIPYLKEALAGACLLLLIICIALGVSLKTAKSRLEANAETIKSLREQVSYASVQIDDLRSAIDEQNDRLRAAEIAGAEAQAYQKKVDEYARQLVNADALISKIQRENIDLRERTKDLSLCETYELCLRSIAGVSQ